MPTLLEKIKAERAAKIASGEVRANEQQIGLGDVSLRGTGLTKREAEKNTRAYEREAAKAVKIEGSDLASKAEKDFKAGIDATIAAMTEENTRSDIQLDPSQIRALAGMVHNKVCVLIGAAGTGKTTITRKFVNEMKKHLSVIDMSSANFTTVDVAGTKIRMLESEAIKQGLVKQDTKNSTSAIAFAAYTGRASQMLRKALPEEWQKNVSTIHTLLGYAPVFEEVEKLDKFGNKFIDTVRRFRPSFDASCKLPYQVYILDEAGMDPIPLFNELIDAIHETSRIILIGDIHQLPPVYGKSVLGYAMRKWPVFELTTIHRQAAGNAIISNAHNVLRGKPLVNASNFHVIGDGRGGTNPCPTGANALQPYFLTVIKKLHEKGLYDPYKDAIIVPQNKGMVGTDELNPHLVTMFNPEIKENGIVVNKRINIHTGTGHVFFAVRDKVMITSNINTVDPPITNGMVGIVESINLNGKYDMKRAQVDFGGDDDDDEEISLDLNNLNFALDSMKDEKEEKDKSDDTDDQRQSSHVLTIKFENGQSYSCSTAGDYRRVTHGYAATCHKSQGGEYPNVIILCHSANAVMLTQEWLYTAITRARNNVYVVGNQRGIDQALKRQVIKGYTMQEKIRSYLIETNSDDDIGFDKMKYPILWEPKEI